MKKKKGMKERDVKMRDELTEKLSFILLDTTSVDKQNNLIQVKH